MKLQMFESPYDSTSDNATMKKGRKSFIIVKPGEADTKRTVVDEPEPV